MAETLKRLYQGSPTSETTLYTAPASENSAVGTVVLSNTTASAITVNLSVVPVGGTGGSSNRILSGFSVSANDTTVCDFGRTAMTGGDFLSGFSSASGLVMTISGWERVD